MIQEAEEALKYLYNRGAEYGLAIRDTNLSIAGLEQILYCRRSSKK